MKPRKSNSFCHKKHKRHKERHLQPHHSEFGLTHGVIHFAVTFLMDLPLFVIFVLFVAGYICRI